MRFISMHKSNASTEASEPPSPELMAGMGPLMGEMMQAGVFLAGEGLQASSRGVRLQFSGAKRTITKGPFVGSNELTDRYLIVSVQSIDEAIEWATRFAGAVDAEMDIRPVVEPWDIGMGPKPAGLTATRFMILHKSDDRTEAGIRRETNLSAIPSNVLLGTEALRPSSEGIRLRYKDGKRTVIDGPFAESKELIAGFSIMEASSIDEAAAWAWRFAELYGDVEMDIRPLYES
jgi:hypothetical protein